MCDYEFSTGYRKMILENIISFGKIFIRIIITKIIVKSPNRQNYEDLNLSGSKTPAEQRNVFRPKLFYNYINLRLKNSQCTKKRKEVRKKESFDSS